MMQSYFTETVTKPFGVRPAAMGTGCDAFYTNPSFNRDSDEPMLIRCKDEATVRVTLKDAYGFCHEVKRCPACLDILRADRLIEVLNVEKL